MIVYALNERGHDSMSKKYNEYFGGGGVKSPPR